MALERSAQARQHDLKVMEALLEHSENPLVYLDRDFNFVRVNRAYAATCRKTPEELVGRNHFDLYGNPENEAIFARARDTGEPAVWREKPFVFPDMPARGVTYWDWTLTPVKNAEGWVEGLVFSLRDVTDLVVARKKIEETERRFRLALRNAPVSVSAQDLELRFLWAFNQRTASPEQVVGKTDTDLFTGVEAKFLTAIKRRVIEENAEHRAEMWLDRPGGRRYLEVYFEPLRDEAGRAVGVGTATVDLTPTKLAEEALRRNEQRFRALVENLSVGVALIDEEGRFQLFNRQFLKLFGLAADSDVKNVNDRDWRAWEVFDETGRPLDIDEHPVRRAVLGGFAVREELVGVRPPGTEVLTWMRVNAEPLFDAAGRLESVICTYADRTADLRAEEELRSHRRLLETVVEHIPAAVNLIGGRDLRLQLVNPAYAAIAPGKAMVGRTLDEIWPEAERDFSALCRWVLETGVPHHVEDEPYRIRRHPDGALEEAYFSWSLHRVQLPGESGFGILNTAWETTERVRAGAELRESEERFAAVFDKAPFGLALARLSDGAYIAVNEAFERITGIPRAEAIGKSSVDLGLQPSSEARSRILELVRAGRAVPDVEMPIVTRTGAERLVSSTAEAVTVRGEKYLLAATEDITERKRLEREREEHLAQIEEANEAKNLFFNTLSHELRTPLSAMQNSVEVLKRPEASSAQRAKVLAILERNVRHQTRLIDDLLDLSRIMRGKVEIAKDALDLREIVAAQVEAAEPGARRARLTLSAEAPERPVPVVGDLVRLGQVVSNLLTNAVKFTEAGGSIVVQTAVEEDSAVVRVRDTGIGISAELLGHLFEPFWQAEGPLSRAKGGLGLGLAIAHSLAELHDGRLEAESAGPGRGSEFTLRLPLRVDGGVSRPGPRSRAAPSSAKRVLVVEDNPDLRQSLVMLLELMGHSAIATDCGASGLEAAERERPDVAIVDIGLPDMSGHEVAARLRADHATRPLRLIALTGYAAPDHRELALKSGFDHLLVKPVEAEHLQQVIEGGRRGDRERR
jgi:PAS domain S-box-containing protein